MPCHYDIYPDLNLILFTYEGVLRAGDVIELADRVDADPGYTRTINELADFRALEWVDFDKKTLTNLSTLLMGLYLRSSRSKKIAILLPAKSLHPAAKTFARIVSGSTPISIRIFEKLAPALAYLELNEHDLPEHSPVLQNG